MRTGELYQRYHGLYVGKVVSVDDPDRLGRIRLKCDQYEDSDDDPLWAVVARPAAGGTSAFFTPNVDDQVVFGFQVGDVNGPVVLGFAHHSSDRRPPEQVDAANKKHGIVTKIGSVVFDEKSEQIVITFTPSDSNAKPSIITMESKGITIDSPQIVLKSDDVRIGEKGADEPLPLGNKLKTWLEAHTHPTAMGPSSPASTVSDLSNVLSTKHKVNS